MSKRAAAARAASSSLLPTGSGGGSSGSGSTSELGAHTALPRPQHHASDTPEHRLLRLLPSHVEHLSMGLVGAVTVRLLQHASLVLAAPPSNVPNLVACAEQAVLRAEAKTCSELGTARTRSSELVSRPQAAMQLSGRSRSDGSSLAIDRNHALSSGTSGKALNQRLTRLGARDDDSSDAKKVRIAAALARAPALEHLEMWRRPSATSPGGDGGDGGSRSRRGKYSPALQLRQRQGREQREKERGERLLLLLEQEQAHMMHPVPSSGRSSGNGSSMSAASQQPWQMRGKSFSSSCSRSSCSMGSPTQGGTAKGAHAAIRGPGAVHNGDERHSVTKPLHGSAARASSQCAMRTNFHYRSGAGDLHADPDFHINSSGSVTAAASNRSSNAGGGTRPSGIACAGPLEMFKRRTFGGARANSRLSDPELALRSMPTDLDVMSNFPHSNGSAMASDADLDPLAAFKMHSLFGARGGGSDVGSETGLGSTTWTVELDRMIDFKQLLSRGGSWAQPSRRVSLDRDPEAADARQVPTLATPGRLPGDHPLLSLTPTPSHASARHCPGPAERGSPRTTGLDGMPLGDHSAAMLRDTVSKEVLVEGCSPLAAEFRPGADSSSSSRVCGSGFSIQEPQLLPLAPVPEAVCVTDPVLVSDLRRYKPLGSAFEAVSSSCAPGASADRLLADEVSEAVQLSGGRPMLAGDEATSDLLHTFSNENLDPPSLALYLLPRQSSETDLPSQADSRRHKPSGQVDFLHQEAAGSGLNQPDGNQAVAEEGALDFLDAIPSIGDALTVSVQRCLDWIGSLGRCRDSAGSDHDGVLSNGSSSAGGSGELPAAVTTAAAAGMILPARSAGCLALSLSRLMVAMCSEEELLRLVADDRPVSELLGALDASASAAIDRAIDRLLPLPDGLMRSPGPLLPLFSGKLAALSTDVQLHGGGTLGASAMQQHRRRLMFKLPELDTVSEDAGQGSNSSTNNAEPSGASVGGPGAPRKSGSNASSMGSFGSFIMPGKSQ